MFRQIGADSPEALTCEALQRWITGQPGAANNTIRTMTNVAASFLSWCAEQGYHAADFTKTARKIRAQHPQVYGGLEAPNPKRWLNRDQAFQQLLEPCQDGTWLGARDEIALRLALSGCRASDITEMTIGDLIRTDQPWHFAWIGKKRRPREIVVGTALQQLLQRWLDQYQDQIGSPLRRTDPLVCRNAHRGGTLGTTEPRIKWGQKMSYTGLYNLTRRTAETAGLGHVAPHDCRRSAAGILHRTVDEHGAHHFDLLDIQRVLDHADPATTMRSYLDPMDKTAKAKAAAFLD